MLRNEVGSDGAAVAMVKTAEEGGLYNQITDALSDPKTLAILGGTALAAAAAVKFGRPLLELGKAAVPIGDDAVLASIREASKGAPQGETTVLGVVRGNRIDVELGKLPTSAQDEAALARVIDASRGSLRREPPVLGAGNRIVAELGKLPTSVQDAAALARVRDASRGSLHSARLEPATDALVASGVPIKRLHLDVDPIVRGDIAARLRIAGERAATGPAPEALMAWPASAPKFDPKIALDRAGFAPSHPRFDPTKA